MKIPFGLIAGAQLPHVAKRWSLLCFLSRTVPHSARRGYRLFRYSILAGGDTVWGWGRFRAEGCCLWLNGWSSRSALVLLLFPFASPSCSLISFDFLLFATTMRVSVSFLCRFWENIIYSETVPIRRRVCHKAWYGRKLTFRRVRKATEELDWCT